MYASHDQTVWGLLQSRAQSDPSRTLLGFEGRLTTYAQAAERTEWTSRSLSALGIVKGDRVAILAANSDLYVLLLFSLARIGAVAVPVNPELTAAEAGYIFRHAGVAAIACTGATISKARAACVDLPVAPRLLQLGGDAGSAIVLQESVAQPHPAVKPAADPDNTWLTLYTSGTTGLPKGVMHSQRNFVIAGEAFVERMHLQPEDRLLMVLPLFHVNALFYSLGGALAAGASLLIVARFSASAFWKTVAAGGVTQVNIIGAVGNILRKRPRSEFVPGHSLRKIYGAGMTAETLEAFPSEFGVPTLIEGYGLTEVPGVCSNPFTGPQKPGSIGMPARHPKHDRPFTEMRILDEDGEDLPAGHTGEIAVRSPIAMQGYYCDPEATAAAFCQGWFLTGDLGYRDADGYYYFVARKKDIIRRRGENVSGAEIDRVVGSHPKVLEAAAIAVPSELGEDEILIVVVPRPGESLAPAEIGDWCATRLAPWKRPRFFAHADSLPYTPTHRVAKFKLKKDTSLLQRAVELGNGDGTSSPM